MTYAFPLLQGSLVLLLFAGGYLLLRRKSTFKLQRLHLLSGLLLSLLPFVWQLLPEWQPQNALRVSMPVLEVTPLATESPAYSGQSPTSWLGNLYLLGVLLSLLPAMASMLQLLRWLRRASFEKLPHFTLVRTAGTRPLLFCPLGVCACTRTPLSLLPLA